MKYLLGCLLLSSLASLWAVYKLAGLKPSSGQAEPEIKITKQAAWTKPILIDVEGAVSKPGVYELPSGSRLLDALEKAEGLAANADRRQIARQFNLAKKLSDEEKIYLPALNEEEAGFSEQALINVNSGSSTELELLPGIGPVTAAKIIERRPYADLNELVTKKAIGQKILDKIINLIAL